MKVKSSVYRLVGVWLMALVFDIANGYTPTSNRRAFFASAAAAVTTTSTVLTTSQPTLALDMDAFMEKELSKDSDKYPQLSEDAALCKYGFPSKATGEACVRAGMSTSRVAGVDAFGKADRGDFVRCKQFYDDNGQGGYVKKTVCDGPR